MFNLVEKSVGGCMLRHKNHWTVAGFRKWSTNLWDSETVLNWSISTWHSAEPGQASYDQMWLEIPALTCNSSLSLTRLPQDFVYRSWSKNKLGIIIIISITTIIIIRWFYPSTNGGLFPSSIFIWLPMMGWPMFSISYPISYPMIIWGWVKALVPSEPQNSW